MGTKGGGTDMRFTVDGYVEMLDALRESGYEIADYSCWDEYEKCAILRHDVDFDMYQALSMAKVECKQEVKSTYFVLLTSDFYNIHSATNRRLLNEIRGMGHTIGLHFDETAYPEDAGNVEKVVQDIKKELLTLSDVLGVPVEVFSYHRPTKAILDADIRIQGAVNSYGELFFRRFKYLSDSRMHWREPAGDIICEGIYPHLHILTHPFWYHDRETEMREILSGFLDRAGKDRYNSLKDNFTNLGDVLEWRDDRL